MASREIFWNITFAEEIVLYLLGAAAVAALIFGLVRHIRRILGGSITGLGKETVRFRIRKTIADILTNRTVLKGHVSAGLMHLCIMWGMLILFIGTLIIAVEYDLFHKLLGYEHAILQGGFYLGFELVLDVFGALLVLGLAAAIIRRFLLKPTQLKRQASDLILPVWLLLIGLTGFVVEGLRMAAQADALGYAPGWAPVGMLFAQAWDGAAPETLQAWHTGLWWLHGVIALAGLGALPFAPKVMHILTSGANLLFRDRRPAGRLFPLDVEGAFERDEVLGFDSLENLPRKDRLDLSSCTECGRCELNCPANISGKVLSPRQIVCDLRAQMNREIPLLGQAAEPQRIMEAGLIPFEAIEACTTCMACVEACPVGIDPLEKILEIRRNEVMLQDNYPEPFVDVFAGTEKRGNPWNEHPTARLDWAKDLDVPIMADVAEAGQQVEILFWVGCSAAFDPRNQKIARAMVNILAEAGLSFAVLGEEEQCTGDPVRRMGHEYLFQMQAEANIELLSSYPFEKILTICPHCYNTFAKEYPDLGGEFQVIHHTQLIADLLAQGKLAPSHSVDAAAVYHDSCYLGRHNRIFDPPRQILRSIPGLQLLEMDMSYERGMCCGGGGGLTWIEEDPEHRVNLRRIEQADTAVVPGGNGSEPILATACPFCMTMLEDGLASSQSRLRDLDVAEIVAESLGYTG
jgi:Fe-S oxidoreductase/nitrate reductase gamma subunit